MFYRITKPLLSNSFFLFGPRGTGKTTFLKNFFAGKKTLWIDLLDTAVEDVYATRPETLTHEIKASAGSIEWVVIDEVQKVSKLLDLVHLHVESSGVKFALTGSSARKLKRGNSNLLAGRAFINHLHPLTFVEMGKHFELSQALNWGGLPKAVQMEKPEEKKAYLRAYALTYLKEEVWAEHLIRKLDPFRRFLEIAAQANGEIVNYTNIARDVNSDVKTVQSYFEILEDTLLGILLEPFHWSIRKRQRTNPKFYFFDLGVKRALERSLETPLTENSYAYGKAFEHLVILECSRLNDYYQKDCRFSYLRTKDDAEIDLIIERPGRPVALVEIKSSRRVNERDTRTLERFAKDFKKAEAFCFSQDPTPKKIGKVLALPWQEGLRALGLAP